VWVTVHTRGISHFEIARVLLVYGSQQSANKDRENFLPVSSGDDSAKNLLSYKIQEGKDINL
jgi:hypothetical protein